MLTNQALPSPGSPAAAHPYQTGHDSGFVSTGVMQPLAGGSPVAASRYHAKPSASTGPSITMFCELADRMPIRAPPVPGSSRRVTPSTTGATTVPTSSAARLGASPLPSSRTLKPVTTNWPRQMSSAAIGSRSAVSVLSAGAIGSSVTEQAVEASSL